MKPLVSILIITYNQEKYIKQAILGAINQKCNFPFEIVIGEDHSSDKTLEICNYYQKLFPNIIRVIANKTNKGLLDNYFDTLLLCQGKYIADCAGDDFWTDEYKIQRQFNILENNPNISLTYTNYIIYLQNKNIFLKNQQGKDSIRIKNYTEYIYELLNQQKRPFIFLGSSCFRKDTFLKAYMENTDFFRNHQYTCEDFQLTFFLLREGNFYYEDKETTVYRVLEDSLCHNKNPQKQFRHLYGTFLLRSNLLIKFEIDAKPCHEYFNSRLIALLSLGIRLNKKEEIKIIKLQCKRINYKPNLQIRSYFKIASSNYLSYLFRQLQNRRYSSH